MNTQAVLRISAGLVVWASTQAATVTAQSPVPVGKAAVGGPSSQYNPTLPSLPPSFQAGSPASPMPGTSPGVGGAPRTPDGSTPGAADATAGATPAAPNTAAPASNSAAVDALVNATESGGNEGGALASNSPAITGDAPATRFRVVNLRAMAIPGSGNSPGPGSIGTAVVSTARGVKIAENQSPLPQDRVFGTFNYFNNLGKIYNTRDGNDVTRLTAYQYTFGLEKTFLDGDASVGFRLPINNLSIKSVTPGASGTSTAVGSLNVFFKYVLTQTTWSDGRKFALTSGLNVTAPTGPSAFAGAKNVLGFRSTYLQPFIGYYYAQDRLYVQGFTAVETPVGTGSRDVTAFYEDINIGYFVIDHRGETNRFLTGLAPGFETHVNIPLNHRGYKPIQVDPASTPSIVNFTYSVNLQFRNRSYLTFAFVHPVTGPRMFDGEAVVQFNLYFGGRRGVLPFGNPVAPVVGG